VLSAVALGTMLAPLSPTVIGVALPPILHTFKRSLAWGAQIVIACRVTVAAGQPRNAHMPRPQLKTNVGGLGPALRPTFW
jgi:hypothetical protein